jgi:hypothetical protein
VIRNPAWDQPRRGGRLECCQIVGAVRRRGTSPWPCHRRQEEAEGISQAAVRCFAVGAAGHWGAGNPLCVQEDASQTLGLEIKSWYAHPPMRPGTASFSNADHLRRPLTSPVPRISLALPCLHHAAIGSSGFGFSTTILGLPHQRMPIRHCRSAKAMARLDSGDDRGRRPWQ